MLFCCTLLLLGLYGQATLATPCRLSSQSSSSETLSSTLTETSTTSAIVAGQSTTLGTTDVLTSATQSVLSESDTSTTIKIPNTAPSTSESIFTSSQATLETLYQETTTVSTTLSVVTTTQTTIDAPYQETSIDASSQATTSVVPTLRDVSPSSDVVSTYTTSQTTIDTSYEETTTSADTLSAATPSSTGEVVTSATSEIQVIESTTSESTILQVTSSIPLEVDSTTTTSTSTSSLVQTTSDATTEPSTILLTSATSDITTTTTTTSVASTCTANYLLYHGSPYNLRYLQNPSASGGTIGAVAGTASASKFYVKNGQMRSITSTASDWVWYIPASAASQNLCPIKAGPVSSLGSTDYVLSCSISNGQVSCSADGQDLLYVCNSAFGNEVLLTNAAGIASSSFKNYCTSVSFTTSGASTFFVC